MSWLMKILGNSSGNVAEVNSENALRTVELPPSGNYFAHAAKTGTIGAAAAANAAVYAARLNPGYAGKAYIDLIKLRYTCVVAFTTPITQARSLVLVRGAGAAATGGTAIATATKKDSTYGASNMDASLGGDARIASTGALTVTGITFETVNLGEMTLAHVGAAGAYYEHIYEFTNRSHPIELNAGELIAVRVGAGGMDAAGTWALGVEMQWRESLSEA